MSSDKDPEYLSTLERGLSVLRSFTRERPAMTLSEVARVTHLSPAVVRRCLITLEALGYVGKLDNRYTLRPDVLVFANLFNQAFDLDHTIRPALQHLRAQTGDSASFTVLSGGDILYVTHVSTLRVIRLQANTGTRFPALVTSTGRVILSTWREHEIRQFIAAHPVPKMTAKTETDPEVLFEIVKKSALQGYAVVSDELDYGVTSIAVPVVIPGYGVVGAVNSSGSTGQVDLENLAETRLTDLRNAAQTISDWLQRSPDLLNAIRLMS
jgi:IclR family pca regulon transcriptional regulator